MVFFSLQAIYYCHLLSIYNLKLVTRAPICNCGVSPIKQTTRLPNHRQCRFSQEYSKFHQPSVYHWRISINLWTLSHVSPKLLGWSNCGPVDESGIVGQDLDRGISMSVATRAIKNIKNDFLFQSVSWTEVLVFSGTCSHYCLIYSSRQIKQKKLYDQTKQTRVVPH